jgi:hypothetical protein
VQVIAVSAAVFASTITSALAQDAENPGSGDVMTAGTILTQFNTRERAAYLAGIIEGLAYARYAQDERAIEGRDCIYNWYYRDPQALRSIFAAFDRYPDALPGRLVGALANTACGGG